MAFPLDQILNILDEECQEGILRRNFDISGKVQKSFFQIPACDRQVSNQSAFSKKGCSDKT